MKNFAICTIWIKSIAIQDVLCWILPATKPDCSAYSPSSVKERSPHQTLNIMLPCCYNTALVQTIFVEYELSHAASVALIPNAEWLSHASYDRWMLSIGKAQKYNTQWLISQNSICDTSAIESHHN
jgi:tryptophan-rich sensory protein